MFKYIGKSGATSFSQKAGAYADGIAICPRVDNYWSKMRRSGEYCDLKFHDLEVLLLIDDEIMRCYRMGKDINIERCYLKHFHLDAETVIIPYGLRELALFSAVPALRLALV